MKLFSRHPVGFADCDTPHNGTAGWLLENFRNLLVMEEGDSRWVARATPRACLEQGKKIAVRNPPTYFEPWPARSFQMWHTLESPRTSRSQESNEKRVLTKSVYPFAVGWQSIRHESA